MTITMIYRNFQFNENKFYDKYKGYAVVENPFRR